MILDRTLADPQRRPSAVSSTDLSFVRDLDPRRTSGIHVDRAAELRPSSRHGGRRALKADCFVETREELERCRPRNVPEATPVGGQPETASPRCGRARAILGLVL